MGVRGLRTKIAIHIAGLLVLGMLSMDFITMMAAQNSLIRAEVSRGKLMSKLIGYYLEEHAGGQEPLAGQEVRARLGVRLEEAGVACFFLVDRDQHQTAFGANRCASQDEIIALTQQAFSEASESVHFIGSTFGFFWIQHEHLVVSAPLRLNGELAGSYSLTFSLEGIYRSLRRSQQVLFLYIGINTVILGFMGIYRVFKLYLQPLARLAQRAEEYKEDDEVLFAVRKEDNELLRLSAALNRLLRRLAAEKAKLRDTVVSLERANTELRQAQAEIVRTEKLASVGRLSAGIAHEIGNPIGIVSGYLELLKQADISEHDRSEYLGRAADEIERISTILRQLLEISRPSQGGPQAVSVHALIQDMAQMLTVQPFMSQVRLNTQLAASMERVSADPNQLRQVFLNLIINAADAISVKGLHASGELVIATENAIDSDAGAAAGEGWVQIHFSDDGIGMSEETKASIFDPFFTTKEPGKGTGLGLSVSFTIVQSLGGAIHVNSQVQKGTRMTVSLPLMPAS